MLCVHVEWPLLSSEVDASASDISASISSSTSSALILSHLRANPHLELARKS
jgi:hypothetical protein